MSYQINEGYYWAYHPEDDTKFIVYHEDGLFYCCGVENPINQEFSVADILCPVRQPES